jgi:hypothetical protein
MTTKKDDYLWKENMNIANFASVRNSMVPNLNLLSSLTTLAVKKQAQFKEKNLQNVEYWRPILIVKKNIMQQFCSEHETQKVVKSNQTFFLTDQFFPMPRSIWHFWTVIGGILTKKNRRDLEKEDNFCQFTNFSLSLFKPTLLWVYQNFLWLW